MKHFFTISLFFLSSLALYAGYVPQTISWDLTKNGIGNTIPIDGTWYNTPLNGVNYAVSAKVITPNIKVTGVYVNNAERIDGNGNEFIKILLPAGVAGNVVIKYWTGDNNYDYKFFYFIQPDTLPNPTDFAVLAGTQFHSLKNGGSSTYLSLPSIPINLTNATCSHTLYLYTKNAGGRYETITWTETEVAPSAKWDFTDATTTTANVGWLNKSNTNALSIQDVSLLYYRGHSSGLDIEKDKIGPWWHNSGRKDGTDGDKKDNAFELTVPGQSVGNITLTMTSTAKAQDSGTAAVYRFFAFIRNAGDNRIPDMYNDTTNATTIIFKGTWTGSASSPSTFTIPINLLNKNTRQTISIIFLQKGGNAGGLRVQEINYTYNTPLQGLNISETDKECITGKLSSSTPMKAYITRGNLVSSGYNTICLPFSMTAPQIAGAFGANCELYTLNGMSTEDGIATINFTSTDVIAEGTPYLIKPAQDIDWTTPLYGTSTGTDVAGSTTKGNVTFIGTYTPTEIQETDYFLGANDLLYHPVPGDQTIKGLRGYFRISNGGSAPVRLAFNQTDTPTSLNKTESVAAPKKIMRNGQLLIESNNRYIDLLGRTIQ